MSAPLNEAGEKTHKITVKWHPKSTACDLCRALCANWSPYTVFPVGSHCHFLKQLLKMFISSLPFSHLFLLPSQWIIPSDFTQKIRAITWLPHPDNTFCGVHAHTSSFFFLLCWDPNAQGVPAIGLPPQPMSSLLWPKLPEGSIILWKFYNLNQTKYSKTGS